MQRWIWPICAALAACAGPLPPAGPPGQYLHDELFAAPSQPVQADRIFALSDAMRAFLASDDFMARMHRLGAQEALFEALYRKEGLRLDYDASTTRNAAETFERRSGNCLSLVIMTAAFARELGLKVHFQEAWLDPTWGHRGNFLLAVGHVNISLGARPLDKGTTRFRPNLMIDFLAPEELAGLHTSEIGEQTIRAMYLNNRAVEAMMGGSLDDAYAYARESIRQAPDFSSAFNTLGVVYLHHGDFAQAEAALRAVLARDPGNTRAMSNLAKALDREGDAAQAQAVRARLAQIDPDPPFHYFQLGQAAMRAGNYGLAHDFFAREVARDEYNDEFHFWLALADVGQGRLELAREQLLQALQTSASPRERDRYSAKLARLAAAAQGNSSAPAPDPPL